jgi:cytochrome b pre-mRNA-processing protein 3
MGFLGLMRRRPDERTGFRLYRAVVAAARAPGFYLEPESGGYGVPDTLDGRFDLVGLHAFLLIQRLRGLQGKGPALAQAVFDAMFADMDMNLREMGVGDLSVGKRVRAMWEAFHGRALAYEAPLEAGDEAGLAAALARNVWRGAAPGRQAERLAALTMRNAANLAATEPSALLAGRVSFLPPEIAAPAAPLPAGAAA